MSPRNQHAESSPRRCGLVVRAAREGAAGMLLVFLATALLGGCEDLRGAFQSVDPVDPGSVQIPRPLSLLLPKSLHIHPFTGTRTFDESGGLSGLEVLVTPRDAYNDPTKAFGTFLFELYEFQPNNPDPAGRRIAWWEGVSIMDPQANRVHWDDFSRAYKFKLALEQSVAVGRRLVLRVYFTSPYSERLTDTRQFVAGD
jgi:hypothetical protein